MKSYPILFFLGTAAFLCSLTAAFGDDVVYTENFDVSNSSAAPIGNYGYNLNYGSTATVFNNTSNVGYSSAAGIGGDGTTKGYFSASASSAPGLGTNFLLSTNTGSFGTIDTLSNVTFQLYDTSHTENIQFALEIGSNWYVSTTLFNNTAWTAPETVTTTATTWDSLSFTSGSTLVLGSLTTLPTTGTITGIGFYDADETNAIRIDTISVNVNAVPEPSTWMMVVAGLFGLGWWRFRRADRAAA